MSESLAPYGVNEPQRPRFVALGKVAGLWHVIVADASGRRLEALTPRRRRAFTPAELAAAERFPTRTAARRAGKGCGFDRTYATPEPTRAFPPAAALRRRAILQDVRPIDATEAEQLADYQASHSEDVAAIAQLPKSQLVAAVMLLRMRAAPNS